MVEKALCITNDMEASVTISEPTMRSKPFDGRPDLRCKACLVQATCWLTRSRRPSCSRGQAATIFFVRTLTTGTGQANPTRPKLTQPLPNMVIRHACLQAMYDKWPLGCMLTPLQVGCRQRPSQHEPLAAATKSKH